MKRNCAKALLVIIIISASIISLHCTNNNMTDAITSDTKGIIYFAYCKKAACQCMREASALMDEYARALVTEHDERSNTFVVECNDFTDTKIYDIFTKRYGRRYTPAFVVTDTNDAVVYKISGYFEMSDIERFDAAFVSLMNSQKGE